MPEENIWDFLDRINGLVDRFEEETRYTSSLTGIEESPTYQAIVAEGWPIVPELIRSYYLYEAPVWGIPLIQIVGADQAAGAKKARQAARLWVRWARSGPAEAPEEVREELRTLCVCSPKQVLAGGCICSASNPLRGVGEKVRLGLIKLHAGIRSS